MATKVQRRHRATLKHEGWAHGHMRPLDIRKGDNVEVISGKDKGKRGVVERILPEQQRIAVRGVNLLKRHTRSGVKGNIQGGIVDFDGPISYSKIMLVCNRCDKRTRIGHGDNELGRRVIICMKYGEP